GRDTSPTSGAGFARDLQQRMESLGVGRIASVSGRYYAMDRDHRWERTEKAYRAIVDGEGIPAESAEQAIRRSYDQGVTDEFLVPAVVLAAGNRVGPIAAGDAILFFNFRADRARQLTRALPCPDFPGFARRDLHPHCTTMTEYDRTFQQPIAF